MSENKMNYCNGKFPYSWGKFDDFLAFFNETNIFDYKQ